jgi:hypothetical protein
MEIADAPVLVNFTTLTALVVFTTTYPNAIDVAETEVCATATVAGSTQNNAASETKIAL